MASTFSSLYAGANASKGILAQNQASDSWAHYQAKSMKKVMYRIQLEALEIDPPANDQNTEKIDNLCIGNWNKKDSSQKELSYFFAPEKKLSKEKEKLYNKKLSENGYELLTLIQWIKWVLVLSIDEFCNASKTRMDIHNMLMKRETANHKKCHTKTK